MMEQFDSMGVPAHFLNMMEQFNSVEVPAHFTYALYTKVRNLTLLMVPQAKLSYECAR